MWNLTGGDVHATDYSNASRTMLFNVKDIKWDEELLEIMDIPLDILPEAKPSVGLFGYTDKNFWSRDTYNRVAGSTGGLFGQICFEEGIQKYIWNQLCH